VSGRRRRDRERGKRLVRGMEEGEEGKEGADGDEGASAADAGAAMNEDWRVVRGGRGEVDLVNALDEADEV
jgi:hypothetical protein